MTRWFPRPSSRLSRALHALPFLALVACSAPAPREERVELPSAPAADGDETVLPFEPLSLRVGGQLFADFSTKMRVDSETLGVGTEIDFEDDLDLDAEVFAGRIDAEWRFARRHSLDFSVFDLNREGERVIDREIQIGDAVFPINADVESEFETTVIKLAYRWGFLSRERWRFGASLGAHWLDMSASWTAGGLGVTEEFEAHAPLPVLGIFGSYALSRRLALTAASEFFGLEYEEYEGFLNDTRIVLEHRTFDHFGFGVGVDYFLIDASVESERDDLLDAEARYDYLSLMAFVRLF